MTSEIEILIFHTAIFWSLYKKVFLEVFYSIKSVLVIFHKQNEHNKTFCNKIRSLFKLFFFSFIKSRNCWRILSWLVIWFVVLRGIGVLKTWNFFSSSWGCGQKAYAVQLLFPSSHKSGQVSRRDMRCFGTMGSCIEPSKI